MLTETSRILKEAGFVGPELLVLEDVARTNIRSMVAKARQAGVVLRPHFKTHQNAAVGRWFAEAGVSSITVSSYTMARYFADHGWDDITIALLLNPLELPRIRSLADTLRGRGGRLGITIDSLEAAGYLGAETGLAVDVWLKVDAGYGRSGLDWRYAEQARAVLQALPPGCSPTGLLTHAGHSYHVQAGPALDRIWEETRDRLRDLAVVLDPSGSLRISVGDTPCCRYREDLAGVDEIRPGNFVFFDLMQWSRGVCTPQEMAAAVVCPVIGLYPEDGRIVLHGGAVHLSREGLPVSEGRIVFGFAGVLEAGAGRMLSRGPVTRAPLVSLSQEHGTLKLAPSSWPDLTRNLALGDLILVWPVHSCLACDLADRFRTLEGVILEK